MEARSDIYSGREGAMLSYGRELVSRRYVNAPSP